MNRLQHVFLQPAPSVPRKLQVQWNMGIIQAREALGLSPERRLEVFGFLYDETGSHLNPHILEKLKPEALGEKEPEPESRLGPELSSLLVSW